MTSNMAEQSDGKNCVSDGEILTINEFVECFDLPKWVEVVGGKDLGLNGHGTCNIQKGMILLLRTLAVETITLSFNDIDTGVKRLVQVSPDTKVKFKVQLPFPDFKNPHMPRTVYETAADLLKSCPTYFQANVSYEDPYLPAIVKSGEVFRFIRQIRHVSDRRVYIQSEDADGNIVELPGECKGNFTAVEDDKSYTLSEILELGAVDRKLKLSHEHVALEFTEESGPEEKLYSNLTYSDGKNVLQRIMGLPLSYEGLITFHKPNLFLAASPSDRQQEVWKIPLSVDIKVKDFKEEDYERPKTTAPAQRDSSCNLPAFKMYKLSELIDTYHEELPVLATLVHYKEMPEEFVHSLEPGCDVIVHDIERYDRILGKSGDMFFSVSKKMEGRFRKTLKTFTSISDLRAQYPDNLSEEIYLKVLEDMACDFPVPYSLQSGDLLRFKSLSVKMHKVKVKSKSFGSFPVVNCEKQKESGSFEKIHLPEDLEISLHETPSRSKAQGFSAEEIFRYKPEFPFSVNFLADYSNIWSCLPINCEIILSHFVTEAFAVVSPVTRSKNDESDEPQVIDNLVRDCLLIPARHHVMLTVKDCLGFPPGYFKFPDKTLYIHCPVEKISKQMYEELIRHNDMAYEDYEAASTLSVKSDILLPTRSKQATEHNYGEAINKRFSKSLNTMFKNKASFFNKLKLRKSGEEETTKPDDLAVENETYQPGQSTSGESQEEENIYDDVNVGGKHGKK